MSETDTLHGLNCPNCGGVIPIPEGQLIVCCPYCSLRSFVRGDRGLRRHQVPQMVNRDKAVGAMQRFFKSNWAIASNAASQAKLAEAFLVYLPFWTVWGRVAAWAFGQERVGSGDNKRYKPREVRIVQEMTWNGAACEVGEFGVTQVPPVDSGLQPFDPEALHNAGMVFEPVGSFSEARAAAEQQFQERVRRSARLDRISQLFVRFFRRRYGLVYHPLWVLRYLYRERAFQVVVDAYSGKVLYGKAPGNTLFRAAALVAGMALGAFMTVDGTAFALTLLDASDDGDFAFGLMAALFLGGLALMYAAYRAFRYGEQYEYRHAGEAKIPGLGSAAEIITQVKDVEKWIDQLS